MMAALSFTIPTSWSFAKMFTTWHTHFTSLAVKPNHWPENTGCHALAAEPARGRAQSGWCPPVRCTGSCHEFLLCKNDGKPAWEVELLCKRCQGEGWMDSRCSEYGEFYKRFFVWIVACNNLSECRASFPRKPTIQFARSIIVFGCPWRMLYRWFFVKHGVMLNHFFDQAGEKNVL